jgi:hypothetical protein
MKTFSCGGFRNVRLHESQDMRDAAGIFAARAARRKYGRSSGYCRTMRLDSWSQDGTRGVYEAFIDYSNGQGATIGHNIWLTVDRQEAK